ncbi:hypothetical protein RB195_002917 [Necator americanus]|uniref:Uncharacterized protein n=1 Tax=Necator americanus TaxID=51031 RepID=A0ABR1DP28_NECAM
MVRANTIDFRVRLSQFSQSSRPHSALGKPDTSGISAWNGSRTSVSSPVAMNAEQRKEIIKKSIERLSRPKHSTVCQRAEQRSNSKGTSLSPYVGTMSSSPTIVEPVTPFEPIDPSRMIIPNAEKSGTICRVPRTRRELSSRMSLFKGENEETPKPLRSNLLKRMGDYKPAKVAPEKVLPTPVPKAAATEVAASMSNAPALDMNLHDSVDENVAVPPPPPPTEADVSCVSSRAPAGRSVASVSPVIKTSLLKEMLSPDGEMLLHATRSLSLEDVSPAGNNLSGGDLGETANVWQQNKPQKLLADSVCSLNTPHRAGPELTKRRYFSDSMEESGTAFPDASLSSTSEEDTVIVNDTIEVRPHSRGPKKDEVMILKPREVVHPDPPSTPNVRRSTRNRMKPVREWLGEKPVYAVSPGGSKTLVGVNEVEVREKRWLKVRTANYRVAQQREMQLAEQKRRLREKRKEEARKRKLVKIRELKRRHRRGEDLDTTVDSIVTSSDEEEEDIEAIIHVR